MPYIPPEEVEEFLANESGTMFTEEQLSFFRKSRNNYRNWMRNYVKHI